MSKSTELLEKVERLKMILVNRATGGADEPEDYFNLRRELFSHPRIKALLPGFLKYCCGTDEFWSHIKGKAVTNEKRRAYLRDQFVAVITMLESECNTPP